MVQMKSALSGIPVGQAMMTDFRTLSPKNHLGQVVQLILKGSQQDFPVVEGLRVIGILTRHDLLVGLAQRDQGAPVAELMRREFLTVDSAEMLDQAFTRLQTCECHTLPVTHHGHLVGLITMDNVGEFLAIQAALAGRSSPLRLAEA